MRRPFRKVIEGRDEISKFVRALEHDETDFRRAVREDEESRRAAVERNVVHAPACPTHPEWVPVGPGLLQPDRLQSLCPFCQSEARVLERRKTEDRPEHEVAVWAGRAMSAGP